MPAALLLLLLALPGAVCRSVFPRKDTLRRTPEESREIVWRYHGTVTAILLLS
eukprot:COSAG06_NODE_34502_length_473_cov_2.997326_2_plen_52_part_01